jgi:hypothetical protein
VLFDGLLLPILCPFSYVHGIVFLSFVAIALPFFLWFTVSDYTFGVLKLFYINLFFIYKLLLHADISSLKKLISLMHGVDIFQKSGSSWSWSHDSWIYIYLCNKCLSSPTKWQKQRIPYIWHLSHIFLWQNNWANFRFIYSNLCRRTMTILVCFRSWSYASRVSNYLYMQSGLITTEVVNSNPTHVEVYSVQHYIISLSVTNGRSVVFAGYYGLLNL